MPFKYRLEIHLHATLQLSLQIHANISHGGSFSAENLLYTGYEPQISENFKHLLSFYLCLENEIQPVPIMFFFVTGYHRTKKHIHPKMSNMD